MKAVKAVRFAYNPTQETRELLESFRLMVNHAVKIGLDEKIHGRFNLRNRIYRQFREGYGAMSCYPYLVAEVAWSILKKHRRWNRRPSTTRLMLKVDAANFSITNGILRIPKEVGRPILIPLSYGDYQRAFLLDENLTRGSVTITESRIAIAFSKEIQTTEPRRSIGYDLNHNSIVGSDETRFDLSEIARLHTEYGVRRSDFRRMHPRDRRLNVRFASSRREKERIKQALGRVSRKIVDSVVVNREAIVLERLRGIRKAHQRGNLKGRDSRRRANLWPDYSSPPSRSPEVRKSGFRHPDDLAGPKLKNGMRVWFNPAAYCYFWRRRM